MLGLKALLDRDYNIIMGSLVLFTSVRLLGNLISDLTYALIDPRIRFK
jgi:ABC-type dipeptide/oligopeptide/nickel transport system permease component